MIKQTTDELNILIMLMEPFHQSFNNDTIIIIFSNLNRHIFFMWNIEKGTMLTASIGFTEAR